MKADYSAIEDDASADGNKAIRAIEGDSYRNLPGGWRAVDHYRRGKNHGVLYENADGLQVALHHEPEASYSGRELGEWLIKTGRKLFDYGASDRVEFVSQRQDEKFVAVGQVADCMRLADA